MLPIGRFVRASTLACILAAAGRLPVHAETLRYEFRVEDHEEAMFEIPFDVVHAGRIDTEISWKGTRILSFRLEGPGAPPVRVSRSGPSPQRLHVTATPDAIAAGREWKMSIRALPARGVAIATLVVETPEPAPPPEAARPAPPPIAPAPMDPWARPKAVPAGASEPERAVFDAVEAFRSIVVSSSGEFRPDACSWQSSFLEYAARMRDAGESTQSTQGPANACAKRFAAAVGKIEWLRETADPTVRGAAPADADERSAWKARRDDQIRPLEQELDQLFALLRGGRCPELSAELWPGRLLACATSCERHFEERSRLGDEATAYADVARDEWPALLAASTVLQAIVARADATETARVP